MNDTNLVQNLLEIFHFTVRAFMKCAIECLNLGWPRAGPLLPECYYSNLSEIVEGMIKVHKNILSLLVVMDESDVPVIVITKSDDMCDNALMNHTHGLEF